MREFVRTAKTPFALSGSLQRRLNSYALAAGSAGVSLLALMQPSQAKVVYTGTHKVIGNGVGYNLDLNHDGTIDFTIQNNKGGSCTTDSCHYFEQLAITAPKSNDVVFNVFGAVAMKGGMAIGPKRRFDGGFKNMAYVAITSQPFGSWINVKNRYLGLKFKIKGETHYGWVRLSVQLEPFLKIRAILTGYAYETVPDKPIVAGRKKETDGGADSLRQHEAALNPKQPTLGLLAIGAPGFSIWRREESVGDPQ